MIARTVCSAALACVIGMAQAPTATFAGRKAWMIRPSGITIITANFRGAKLTIKIHAWQVHVESRVMDPPRPYPQCTYSQDPCSITDWIHVALGGRTQWLESSKFADLGDMHYLSVSSSGNRLVLIIGGGDGMSSYDAHFIYQDGEVVKRILYDGPEEDFALQVTDYHERYYN